MKYAPVLLLNVFLSATATRHDGRAPLAKDSPPVANPRVARDVAETPADVMARNILEWIQGIYRQGVRKTRQQSDASGYLPPFGTSRAPERPRPFEAPSTPRQPAFPSSSSNTNYQGYQQPSSLYTPPNVDYSPSRPSSFGFGSQAGSTPRPTFDPPNRGPASVGPSSPSVGYPSPSTTYVPQRNTGFPSSTGRPAPSNGGYSPNGGYTPSSNVPSGSDILPLGNTGGGSDGYSSSTPTPPFDVPSGGGGTSGGSDSAAGTGNAISPADDDANHPPHIHSIDVECSKTTMTINLEFNRAFDGVIYSKGFYANPECRYVEENSGKTMYSFTVNLDSCGTQFINDFEGEAGQAYLENTLVLQNEAGIQEVWDTIRKVRCLWEGNLNKAVSVSLSVDMLNQEIVTFSGDTATAKMDIQIGRGPFAPTADGLVKIGENMTLVVSVEGDPGFDLQVRDCVARDETSTNVVRLTDERGCILKPKLFGAFQKTKETGNTGASIIAYAFFQAFKFPDVMDLLMECNVELCKTDCEPCPDDMQQIDPSRRRRDLTRVASNSTDLPDSVHVGHGFRVFMPEELSLPSAKALRELEEPRGTIPTSTVCMSHGGFYVTFSLMLNLLIVATVVSVVLYAKLRKIKAVKEYDLHRGC